MPDDNRRRLGGVLSGPVDGPARLRAVYPEAVGAVGLAVSHRGSGFRGHIVRWERDAVVVQGASGTERLFQPLPGAFLVGATATTLTRPRPGPATTAPSRTASGSVAVPRVKARVARASRILVEGVHDAELVEKVWGDDLRVEGVVVERLDGIDVLEGVLADLRPGPDQRVGVLVDHLVPGSKESRLAAAVAGPHVLVTGTPFVDVWQAVRPAVAGLAAWPVIPRGQPWKAGICAALGQADPALLWRKLLGAVTSYADLEPELVGAVERLIDFVAAPQ